MTKSIFDIAIATIFAREVLEGAIVIIQYRTVLKRSPDWQDPDKQNKGIQAINHAAVLASIVAFLVCVVVAVTLVILSKGMEDKVANIIEGVSKLVASVCILVLSVKIPKWLGLYASKKMNNDNLVEGLTLKSVRFNVAWNIWREVAETGIFIIPSLIAGNVLAIPLSAVIGVVLSLILGFAINYGNKKLQNKFWLAFVMSSVTGMLSVGLFSGGSHNLEQALGETKTVWQLQGAFWSTDRLPMTLLKPFGYYSSYTVLQTACFWIWLAILLCCHVWNNRSSKKILEARRQKDLELEDIQETGVEPCSSENTEDGICKQ